MAAIDNAALLAKFKLAIGDLTPGTELDDYYTEKLTSAYAALASCDISETVLATDLGMSAIVLWAKVLMEGGDVAENKTLQLLRNTLSAQTKGERFEQDAGGGEDASDGT